MLAGLIKDGTPLVGSVFLDTGYQCCFSSGTGDAKQENVPPIDQI